MTLGSLPFAPKPLIFWRPDRKLWMCVSMEPVQGAFGLTPRAAYAGWLGSMLLMEAGR